MPAAGDGLAGEAAVAATGADSDQRHVTLHLTAQATIDFNADQLWPMHGDYGRFGIDLESFADEVLRRLRTDGYLGYRLAGERITVIPFSAIKRIDFR